jgi:hypothetical protein
MANKPNVIAIHRDLELAHFDDGTTMSITDWYDDSGDECEIEDATFAITRYRDKYVSIDLKHFPKKFEPVEDIEVMLSTRDLAILCNAAVLKGQSLQDFVFLAAWNAANTVLNETRRDDDICSGVKVYKKDEV